MAVEFSAELRRRAAVHAALADPARLAIADTLAVLARAGTQLVAALWRRHSRVSSASAGTRPAERVNRAAIAATRRHRLPVRPHDAATRLDREFDTELGVPARAKQPRRW